MSITAAALVLLLQTVPPPPFQRVLVPVSVVEAPGAGGTRWASELWVVNVSGEPATVSELPCLVATSGGCAPTATVPPNRSVVVPPTPGRSAAEPGVLMLLPTHLAPLMGLTLHVRDLSRQSESWGTEIPVVREVDFTYSGIYLTGIASGPDFRQTLRIYALLDRIGSVQRRVKLYGITATEDRLLRDEVITLEAPPPPPPNRIGTPLAQKTLTSDFFGPADPAIIRMYVTIEGISDPLALPPLIPFWAFVSVTNNATQQVTTVTPN